MEFKINNEILEYIDSKDYDEDIKKFLKAALLLEFRREKEDARNYFRNYDNLISNYID